jgi:hypothetical protein
MTPVRIVPMSCADDLVSFVLQRANGPDSRLVRLDRPCWPKANPLARVARRWNARSRTDCQGCIAVNDLLIFGRLVEGDGRRVRAEKTLPPRRAVGPLIHEEPWSSLSTWAANKRAHLFGGPKRMRRAKERIASCSRPPRENVRWSWRIIQRRQLHRPRGRRRAISHRR